jgi:outer membrane protein TolC
MKNYSPITPITLFALLLFSFSGAHAEQVTLPEALRAALADHPLVRAQTAETEAAQEDRAAAASRYLPRLHLSETYYRTNEPGGSLFISLNQEDLELSQTADAYNDAPTRQDFETRLTLLQPLYDADISYGTKRAAIVAEAASAAERQGLENAAMAVLNAYLDVQMNRTSVSKAEAAVREAEEVFSIAEQRGRAGLGLQADTLRARSLVNDARLALLTARHALRLARYQLAFAVGRPDGEVDIAVPLTLDVLVEPGDNELLQRGDLEALALQAEEARLAVSQERAGLLPKADLQASYIMHDENIPLGSDADAWSLTAGLRWEFFDGFERSHRQAGAEARRKAASERHTDQARQARLALEKARLQSQQAQVAIELAQSTQIAAEETRSVLLERYHAGLAPLSDLLAVQAELERARHSLVTAEADQLRARALTHFQQGTLLSALSLSEGEASR